MPEKPNFLPPTSELVRASEPVLSVSCPVPLKRMAPKATAPTPKPKAPYQRDKEWVALKLTGKRAQKGKTAAGTVRYTYEVEWKGNYKPTYEPRENLGVEGSRVARRGSVVRCVCVLRGVQYGG